MNNDWSGAVPRRLARREPRGLRAMPWLRRLAAAMGMTAGAGTLGTAPAAAQEAPWQFSVAPYLWAAGIKGTTQTPPSGISFNQDFTDILKDLSAIPLMAAGEVRRGPAAFAFDLVWMKISSDINTRNILFNDGKSRLSQFQFTGMGLYRVIEQSGGKIDVGGGFRLWSVSSKATLNAGLLPAVSASIDKTFVDPILAARFEFALGGRWSLTAYGDVGGFGISSHVTWQAMGTLNYRMTEWSDVRLGWRHMAVDRDKIKLDLSGPILAGTFRF